MLWSTVVRKPIVFSAAVVLATSCTSAKEKTNGPGQNPWTSAESTQRASETVSSSEICPDEITYTGEYNNRQYGFSFVIPLGFEAHWNSPRCSKALEGCICMGDHGCIVIGWVTD